ncbi:DUF1190 domain-containing protein [Rheinheimera texasensis]|jgi:uncharacterized protein YgiB involved in biofilm formation|uniref:DUF1190 domain-containing protein n=1 Tax=Rheinheimera texasensis TaxID=306205 RepID=UPI0004E22960|nr:DUF1190 domain-containing protein [Rheinheimera texasensis]
MSKMTKRSRKAALVLMVPATGFFLASCSSEEPVTTAVYKDAEECAAFYNPPESCKAEFAKAEALHQQVAPKYQTQAECEADFGTGNCPQPQQQQASSGGFFMPMMMGFLAGQMLNKSSSAKQYVPTQPLYKSKDDLSTFRTANNQPVARQTGPVNVMPSRMQVAPGKMVNRGGFGAQAQRRSDQQSSSFGG